MNRYAIYSTTTGAILRVVNCPAGQASAQLRSGEALLPCAEGVSDATHRVESGEIVEI